MFRKVVADDRMLGGSAWICIMIVALAGCQEAPRPQSHIAAKAAVEEIRTTPKAIAPEVDDDCGLRGYPVSRSTEEIVADGLQKGARSKEYGMLVKVAIDSKGNITHLRVLRPAFPDASNTTAINSQVIDSMKKRHYSPTVVGGKAVAVCSDVSVTVDLQ
jgi:hypothetical protein